MGVRSPHAMTESLAKQTAESQSPSAFEGERRSEQDRLGVEKTAQAQKEEIAALKVDLEKARALSEVKGVV